MLQNMDVFSQLAAVECLIVDQDHLGVNVRSKGFNKVVVIDKDNGRHGLSHDELLDAL